MDMYYEGIIEMCLFFFEIINFINGVCRFCLIVIIFLLIIELREVVRNNLK